MSVVLIDKTPLRPKGSRQGCWQRLAVVDCRRPQHVLNVILSVLAQISLTVLRARDARFRALMALPDRVGVAADIDCRMYR